MERGVTVEPVMVEGVDGEVIADFEVQAHPGGSDSSRPGYQGQEFYQDSHGNVHHQYGNVDFDALDENAEPQSDLPSDYISNVQELFGGREGYLRATDWARQNLSADFINDFNTALNSGEEELMTPALEQFLNLYQGGDQDEAVEDVEPFPSELQSEIFQAVGGEQVYNNLTQWASDNLDDQAVTNYNLAMESGDEHLIRTAVRWLVNQRTN